MWMTIQIAPFPYGSIGPATCHIGFGFVLHVQVVFWQGVAFGQIAHHVEQPVAHATREVAHLIVGAGLESQIISWAEYRIENNQI